MRALVVAAILLAATRADAHGMRTAYIELTEGAPGHARVVIRGKVPVTGVSLEVASPCVLSTTETGTWLDCPDLAGASLTAVGLGPVASEAVVFVRFVDGGSTQAVLTAHEPSWTIPGAQDDGALAIAGRYVWLGVIHIATGADHLLFLLGLVLCLRRLRAVMLAETAFTLSHTLSFSASALGWVHVSAPAAEACIAASLVLVALDIGNRPDAAWKTAGLAFAFGLVHGLGFAGGLAEIGLPATAVPAALAGFAAGVELGQVVFLLAVVGMLTAVARAPRIARGVTLAGAYAIGGIGWCWLFERVGALV